MSHPSQSPKPLRPGQACLACKHHKVKCSGERPACKNCNTLERVCEYRAAPPSPATLEDRLRVLEGQISEFESLRNATPYDSGSASGSSTGSPNSSSSSPSSFRMTRRIPALEQWNPSTPMPSVLKRELFNIFLGHYQEYNLDIYIPRWKKALEYPSNHPESFHPALLNAVYFSACSLAGAPNYSEFFLRTAREEMRASLSMCDRVEHWLYASIILASEISRKGSPAAIMTSCAEMISIAFACNLHKFSDTTSYQTFDWGLMPAPRSDFHAAERINLWWAIFILERSASIALCVPGSIPLEACMSITTSFPLPWDEISQYGLCARPGWNLYNFCKTNDLPRGAAARDTLLAMHAKAIATYASSSQVAKSFMDDPSKPHWNNYQVAENCLQTMLSTLPLFAPTDPSGNGLSMGSILVNTLRPSDYLHLISIHLSALSAEIVFSGIMATQDMSQYRRRVSAAAAMARLARTIPEVRALSCPNLLLGAYWHSGAEVLVNEIRRCQSMRLDVASLKSDLSIIIRCMEYIETTSAELPNYINYVKYKILMT